MCSFFDHNANSHPYYACYVQPDFAPPRENDDVVLTLFDLSLSLAQLMGFEGVNFLGMQLSLLGLVHVCIWNIHLIWRII